MKVIRVQLMGLMVLLVLPAGSLAQAPRTTRFASILTDLVHRNPANFTLDRGKDLDLTADQVARLEAIDDHLAAWAGQLIERADSARTPSEGMSRREFREALRELRWELRSASEAVREVLTEEQLERARAIRASPR